MPAGLAPWPAGVGVLDLEWDVDGRSCSTSWWFLDSSRSSWSWADAEAVCDDFIASVLPPLLALTTAAATATACSVTVRFPTFARARVQFEPAPGVWSGAQAMSSTVGLRWIGLDGRRGSARLTRLPSAPDFFIDSTWRLSASGYANLRDHGATFVDRFNRLHNPAGGTLLHGTLVQVRDRAPLIPSEFDPTVSVAPIGRVATIRRRLPRGLQIAPA